MLESGIFDLTKKRDSKILEKSGYSHSHRILDIHSSYYSSLPSTLLRLIGHLTLEIKPQCGFSPFGGESESGERCRS